MGNFFLGLYNICRSCWTAIYFLNQSYQSVVHDVIRQKKGGQEVWPGWDRSAWSARFSCCCAVDGAGGGWGVVLLRRPMCMP